MLPLDNRTTKDLGALLFSCNQKLDQGSHAALGLVAEERNATGRYSVRERRQGLRNNGDIVNIFPCLDVSIMSGLWADRRV